MYEAVLCAVVAYVLLWKHNLGYITIINCREIMPLGIAVACAS